MIKKLPWGIIAGICACVLFFTLAGTIAAYIILNAIAEQTNTSVTMFAEWYQVVLFIADILLFISVVGSTVMFALRVSSEKKEGQSDA